jgi:transcriptional regulator EpsA
MSQTTMTTTTTSAILAGHIRLFEGVERRQVPRLVSINPVRAVETPATTAAANVFHIAENESARFMQVVQAASKIGSHLDLYRLLQGGIQHFIPHQILISAWGDFRGAALTLDVVSSLPGVRTDLFTKCGLEPVIKGFLEQFIAGGRRPLQLGSADIELMKRTSDGCPIQLAMQRMNSIQVFGLRNERDNQETLYIALNPSAVSHKPATEYHAFLIDSVIAQIDVAFRKVAALKTADAANEPVIRLPENLGLNLSSRELDVLTWLTQGKTNPEIAELLNISAFTVKNHAQKIFKKLKVNNRTEVAALMGFPQS